MRVTTLIIIFLLLLIPDIIFVIYLAVNPVFTTEFLHAAASSLLPAYSTSNLLPVVVLIAFLYGTIVASALFYVAVSPIIRRIIGWR
jgi:hypothetical protein